MIEKTTEKYVVISLKIILAYELISMLLGWGSDVKVLSPGSLRKQLMNILDENLKQYKR
ncbi:MAG: WYL domain-containing protein [Bacteroidia bacterium]|nr:WYL domain-containing protein [Bacteroidia bacterium]